MSYGFPRSGERGYETVRNPGSACPGERSSPEQPEGWTPTGWTPTLVIAALCLLCATPLVAGENYALLVAVGDYDVKDLRPLKYTRADILEFQQALVASGFPLKNIVLLHDDVEKLADHCRQLGPQFKPKDFFPLAANIRSQVELLLGGLRDDDSVIVAFSGHGVQFAGEKKSYFCPADADLERKETLIGFDELYASLKDSDAARKLLLVDACQNDPLSENGKNRATVKLDSVTRPQSEPVPEGIIALFSCKAGQKSYEWPELKHGIFFYHVLEGWNGNGDLNGDGKLSYQELSIYTERKTAEFARVNLKALQTPQLRTDFSGEWILKELKAGSNTPPPPAGRPGEKSITNSLGAVLVRIEPGEYLRGAGASDSEAQDDEKPQHRVRISKAFYLGQTEVTQGQWKAVMGTEPWKGQSYVKEGTDYAATYVSWEDAQEFCRKLSAKEGTTYRLPTEAEWEYACRAGTTTVYSFGNDASQLGDYAWWGGIIGDGNAKNEQYAHQVGLKKPNSWGLHDMHGNVWEWCQDGYDENAYKNLGTLTTDPVVSSPSDRRVLRGGSWNYDAWFTRAAFRYWFTPDYRNYNYGFRVSRTP